MSGEREVWDERFRLTLAELRELSRRSVVDSSEERRLYLLNKAGVDDPIRPLDSDPVWRYE